MKSAKYSALVAQVSTIISKGAKLKMQVYLKDSNMLENTIESKRINLLSPSEIAELYERPEFNQNERSQYFSLDDREFLAVNQYSNVKTRVCFILQLGYFKAKQQFFRFTFLEVDSDIQFL